MTLQLAERPRTAFLDGEDSPDILNPIHSTAVAAQYGFRAALVGGVTVYGWLTPVILEVLGERWLSAGWADVRFRRPVYPGDALTARCEAVGDGSARVAMVNAEGVACIEGEVGNGMAAWVSSFHSPVRRIAEERPAQLLRLTLDSAPTDQDLRPVLVPWSRDDARTWALEKQRDDADRWTGESAIVHPSWIAARMTPLLHHSFDYGPSIHTRSQVQHLAVAPAGQAFTVAGHFIQAYEEKGHQYAELDGVLLGEDGHELARMRHTTIFRIRPPRDA
jgi:hypothetical protein